MRCAEVDRHEAAGPGIEGDTGCGATARGRGVVAARDQAGGGERVELGGHGRPWEAGLAHEVGAGARRSVGQEEKQLADRADGGAAQR